MSHHKVCLLLSDPGRQVCIMEIMENVFNSTNVKGARHQIYRSNENRIMESAGFIVFLGHKEA